MNIINCLKNFFPLELLFLLKYNRQFRNQMPMTLDSDTIKIYYLDAPSYGNIGDQAIAYAIRNFAETYFSNYEFVEVLQDDVPQYIKYLKQNIRSKDIIFLTGGGNMGNRYRIYEAARRFVIKNFPDNQVVIFPQTIDYSDNLFGTLSLRFSQKIYGKHKRLTLLARERFSFEKMTLCYPNNQVLLCPDIVLSLARMEHISAPSKVGVCLRDDRERYLKDEDRENIHAVLERLNKPIVTVTTMTEIANISQENRPSIVQSKLEEIATYSLLVTDRLHAMIFAVLTHTPCIVFQNKNAKVAGVYEWVNQSGLVRLISNIEDFGSAAKELIDKKSDSSMNMSPLFEHVVKTLRKG